MGFFKSLRNIKKWFTDKTGISRPTESTKRKHDECEILNNKRARMDDSLVEIVEISDESLSEAEEVEITEPGLSTVPLRASPPVMLVASNSSNLEDKYSFISSTKGFKKSTLNMEDSLSRMHITNSLSNDKDKVLSIILKNYVTPKSEKAELSSFIGKSPLGICKENCLNQSKLSQISDKENVDIPELSFHKNRIIKQEMFYERILRKFREKQAISASTSTTVKQKSLEDVFMDKFEYMKKELEKIDSPQKKDVFPGYSKEMVDFISRQMSGPQNEHIVKGKNIKKSDLRTVYSSTAWLNDEVINHYINLIIDRDPNSLHAFDTFFYSKLSSQGYQSVRRWSRKKDIFACKKMFTPIHLGNHWCLACVNFVDKTIKYYDSLGGKNPKCLNTIFYYLKEEYKNKKDAEFDCSGWRLMDANDCPQQRNGYDCGVFTCINAEYLARDAKLDFTQDDMPKLRHRVCYEILKDRLCY